MLTGGGADHPHQRLGFLFAREWEARVRLAGNVAKNSDIAD